MHLLSLSRCVVMMLFVTHHQPLIDTASCYTHIDKRLANTQLVSVYNLDINNDADKKSCYSWPLCMFLACTASRESAVNRFESVVIWWGLINDDPDIDAIYRLTNNKM